MIVSACVQHAALFVNVKGCGYPPTVRCDSWIEEYGVLGSRYRACFQTLKNFKNLNCAQKKKLNAKTEAKIIGSGSAHK
jgi:hypothetical protein